MNKQSYLKGYIKGIQLIKKSQTLLGSDPSSTTAPGTNSLRMVGPFGDSSSSSKGQQWTLEKSWKPPGRVIPRYSKETEYYLDPANLAVGYKDINEILGKSPRNLTESDTLRYLAAGNAKQQITNVTPAGSYIYTRAPGSITKTQVYLSNKAYNTLKAPSANLLTHMRNKIKK